MLRTEDGSKGQYLLCLESSDVSNICADLQVFVPASLMSLFLMECTVSWPHPTFTLPLRAGTTCIVLEYAPGA